MRKQIILLFFMFMTIGVLAITINIPEDYATIQAGIDSSEDGDEIIVAPGTYVENINFNGKVVLLGSLFYTTQDTSYISQTIIDGNLAGCVVCFYSGEDSSSILTGFTITNGQAYAGGAIRCIYSSPSLENLTIMDNSAEYYGGGIYCNSSSPSLENVTITDNSAGSEGGGIYCYSSSPGLENVTITGNSADDGGGIFCDSSSPSLENVTITNNLAGNNGGGIVCNSSSSGLEYVTITNNSAENNGGGIYCDSLSSPSLVNVTITDNSADEMGGGIYCQNNSSPVLENVTITENSADEMGGGIFCNSSSPSLTIVTITGNSAVLYGGGIYCEEYSNPGLENVTITNNSAGRDGGGIYCGDNSSPSLENVTIAYGTALYGGGIYCESSSPSIANVTIADNSAGAEGGGIYCYSSSPDLDNVTITNNSAENYGGGIYCNSFSSPDLENVTITENSATYNGGGIYCTYSSPVFSSENRCNIYLNNTNNRGNGCDIYSTSVINVIVDTFTVLIPTDFHAAPIEFFTFDILQGFQEQINADLYVSPDGNNTNTGLTIDDPLQTIQYACSVILANSQDLHTIFLAEGTYSPSINGEFFPVDVPDFVSLCGVSESGVILNAEGMTGVIRIRNVENAAVANLTITNGAAEYGGGIYCESSNPNLENVTITDNSAEDDGGGIYCYSSNPSLENVTITDNSVENDGGGICCYYSSPSLVNVTIANNAAEDDGGGIYCGYSSPSLENVTIANNSAEDDGGGIYCSYSSPSLCNVTIADNSAIEGGGISCCYISRPILVNCIFWNNSPQEVDFPSNVNPNAITIAYSDIAGGISGIETNNNCTVNWLEGNIDADPLFVDAEIGNYNLTEDSPCIDTGTSYFEYEGELLVDISEDEYYGAAPDMGAYESPFTSFHNDEIEPVKDCMTIYPNPFNPETNILFELSAGSNVLLEIYNIKGQKVTTLINEPFEAGSHKVIWNAENYSSGIYLLRFDSAERSEIKKLILLK
jgi:predicted outer membrane repeat protein